MSSALPFFDIDKADEPQRQAALEIQRDRNAIGQPLGSIWSSMMASPNAARRIAKVGAHCRFQSALSEQQREIAILATTYEIGFDYETRYHEAFAAQCGVGEETLAALRSKDLRSLPEDLRCVAESARAVACGSGASPAPLQSVRRLMGDRAAVDLVATVSYYVMLQRVSDALLPAMLTPVKR